MSTNDEAASGRAPGEPENDSVYDFLYQDVRRVGSYLAQFDAAGHLTAITQSESIAKGAKRSWKATIGGTLPPQLGAPTAEIGVERGPAEGGSESSERAYDPLWTNATTLLDYLAERNLIERDIGRARIGQFVLAAGRLQILDVTLLRNVWEKPSVGHFIRAGIAETTQQNQVSRQVRRHLERHGGSQPTQAPSEADLMLDLVSVLPHSIQATVLGDDYSAWCNLSEENLVGHASDLVLKHGVVVPGRWFVLGVLDALAGDVMIDPGDTDTAQALAGNQIGAFAAMIAALARQFIGRPLNAYGMTPLLIFREVARGDE